jgi:hypothetical protein
MYIITVHSLTLIQAPLKNLPVLPSPKHLQQGGKAILAAKEASEHPFTYSLLAVVTPALTHLRHGIPISSEHFFGKRKAHGP